LRKFSGHASLARGSLVNPGRRARRARWRSPRSPWHRRARAAPSAQAVQPGPKRGNACATRRRAACRARSRISRATTASPRALATAWRPSFVIV